jgi:xanthine/CO dehydrogenase XdhC/CoxF family maturation factor
MDLVDSGETIENATWEQAEAAIRSLDASRVTALTVERPDRSNVLVGGGNGRYILCITTADERLVALANEAKADGTAEELVAGGQPGQYPSRLVVDDLDTVLRAARTYFETGTPDSGLSWIED